MDESTLNNPVNDEEVSQQEENHLTESENVSENADGEIYFKISIEETKVELPESKVCENSEDVVYQTTEQDDNVADASQQVLEENDSTIECPIEILPVAYEAEVVQSADIMVEEVLDENIEANEESVVVDSESFALDVDTFPVGSALESVDDIATESIEEVEIVEQNASETVVSVQVVQSSVPEKIETSLRNNSNSIPASVAVPLMTESILSALSEIHGEKSLNMNNGVSLCNSNNISLASEIQQYKSNENNLSKSKQTIRPITKRGRPALNDKQLLAILQDGTETTPLTAEMLKHMKVNKKHKNVVDVDVSREIVLKQLREFPRKRKNKDFMVDKIEDVKIPKAIKKKSMTNNVTPSKDKPSAPIQMSTPASDISSLLEEWVEEEPTTPLSQESITTSTPNINKPNVDSSSLNNDESFVKPKRVSRIIKKKIIYDPDNPETFKFASDIVQAAIISGETTKQTNKTITNETKQNKAVCENVQPKIQGNVDGKPNKSVTPSDINKNIKTIHDHFKASNKSTTKKRLSEVDKLLMDEGAVNMLYQMEQSNNDGEIQPQEQNKRKKTISNEKKVKIIKKAVINHSKANSDQPAKVFRVRKEKVDANALNSKIANITAARASMQSPSLSEMSGVSVNESRIIRRHSSSSFSSGCLSPRPQSPSGDLNNSKSMNDSGIHTKLSKRKGARQKKVSKSSDLTDSSFINPITPVPDVAALQMHSFTQLSMNVSDNVAHIIVNPTGNTEELYDYQVITELTAAIRLYANGTNAVLLSSHGGALCGGLDLRGLLQPTVEQQRHSAEQLLDAFRELMVALCECRSALVCCVGSACTGPGVALLTLCDLALASDRATFCVTPRLRRKLPPEGAAVLTRPSTLPPQIVRELILCGRKLTASEALQRGLVSRTLWPDRFIEEVLSIVGELAQHPAESFSIMKNILRRGEVTAVTSALRHEGRLLVDYWCSAEGQDAIRETHASL